MLTVTHGEYILDFNELKRQYKKRIKDIQREKIELDSKASKLANELEKIVAIYHKFNTLLKEHKWGEAIDFLKINGFKNLNDFNEKNELLAKNGRDIIRCSEQLEAEEKKEFIICPECNGLRYKITYEYVMLNTRRERISHPQKCILCDSQGRILTKELLNCDSMNS